MIEQLVQIRAPGFTAGFVIKDDKVIAAAPIIKHLLGKTEAEVRAVIKNRGWKAYRA